MIKNQGENKKWKAEESLTEIGMPKDLYLYILNEVQKNSSQNNW